MGCQNRNADRRRTLRAIRDPQPRFTQAEQEERRRRVASLAVTEFARPDRLVADRHMPVLGLNSGGIAGHLASERRHRLFMLQALAAMGHSLSQALFGAPYSDRGRKP